jgi:hypothetical protein
MPKPSKVSETLYHYTTWDGLLGILQPPQTLRATHYKFLNDYSEIVLLRPKLISWVLPYVREAYEKLVKQSPQIEQKINQAGGLGQVIHPYTEVVVDAQYKATGEIYILSFCRQHKDPRVNNNGLLSQWRGYGAGGGFALVFNTQKLEEMLEIEATKFEGVGHFCDVVYSDDEKKFKDEISPNLSIIADVIVEVFFSRDNLSEEERLEKAKDAYSPFVSSIIRYKHCGFSEENEIRVVVLPTVVDEEYLELAKEESVTLKPEKERKFRIKNGEPVPYIELFKSSGMELPIEKIIVGPHKEKEARAAALRVMLRNTKVKISCSEIPFVG